jgi:PKD repeat protein
MTRDVSFLQRHVARFVIVAFIIGSITVSGAGIAPWPAAAEAGDRAILHRHDPFVQAAIAVQNKYTRGLMADRDVLGTGVGAGEDGMPVIRVYTRRHGVPGIPDRLESMPVKVHVAGLVMALGNTTARYRPAPIGVSTGHFAITAGTIGARVKNSGGQVFALSNNHVYANGNDSVIGDEILQPGPYDGGTVANDQLGTLAAFVPIDFTMSGSNLVDAAIAAVPPGDLGNATLGDGYGTPNSATRTAAVGLAVQKYGRTTSLTRGAVSAINVTVEVCYEVLWVLCIKSAYFDDQVSIETAGFSAGGDSGSLIVTDDAAKNPVALLFAGSDTVTFANRIENVLSAFGVTVDGAAGGNLPPAAAFSYNANGLTVNFTDTSTDPDGTVTARNWSFGDGSTSTDQNPGHAYAAAGTYTVTLTVTDDDGATGTTSKQVTVVDPAKTVHVGDLDGIGVKSLSRWKATVTALVHNSVHSPVSGATVRGTWKIGGASISGSCKTGKSGTCQITRDRISLNTASVAFDVTGITSSGNLYDSASNHETAITINRP